MPWWAYAYIAFFLLLSIYGIFDDLHKRNKVVHIGGAIASTTFVVLFVVGYFYSNIGNTLGLYVFLMLAIGVLYEFASIKRDLADVSLEHNLSEKQSSYINFFTMVIVDVIVVPGYVFGLMIGLRNANL